MPDFIPTSNNHDQTVESLRLAYDAGAEQIQVLNIDGVDFIASSRPFTLQDINKITDAYASSPRFIEASVEVIDVPSFALYLLRFESAKAFKPLVKASIKWSCVTATIDYHTAVQPEWGKHICKLISVRTPQWEAFKQINDKPMSQDFFAKFVDRWGQWISAPDAATLSELILQLEGVNNTSWASKKNRANGSYTVSVQDDVVVNVKIPEKLFLRIAPFYHSPDHEVVAKVWLAVKEGVPAFTLSIDNIEQIEYEAMQDTFAEVTKATGLEVIVGP